LVRWLQATVDVLHGAATARDSFELAASVLVEMIGLDAGRVLLLEGEAWRVKALREAPGAAARKAADPPREPSTRILSRLRQEKRTFIWHLRPTGGSLEGIQVLIAAPILDTQGQVIGALYGDRGERGPAAGRGGGPVTTLQAMLVQLLAGAVAAGL